MAASATTLSRLMAASAIMMTAAAETKSLAEPADPTMPTSSSFRALTLSAMTTSVQAPTSLTSGTPRSALAKSTMESLRTIAPAAPSATARGASAGGSRRQARAMTMALSAPSSRSTKKTCRSRKIQAAPSITAPPPGARRSSRRTARRMHRRRTSSSRLRALRCLWLRARLQEPHEVSVGAYNHRGRRVGERAFVGLQRAIERIERRVSRKRFGERPVGLGVAFAAGDRCGALRFREDNGAVMVGAGLDLLRPLEALSAKLLRLALPLRFHAVVDRLAGLERQVSAVETHFVDLDAKRFGFGGDLGLDQIEDMAALIGQQRPQGRLPERASRR